MIGDGAPVHKSEVESGVIESHYLVLFGTLAGIVECKCAWSNLDEEPGFGRNIISALLKLGAADLNRNLHLCRLYTHE